MHISLDSALGRQRRLNQVGETISSIAAPTAAYSLRSLTGGDPKVVRVRRGSDNHEQDFTSSEVSSGALQDFVNAQVVAPLDIQALSATGRDGDFLIAKAAYSLRSLGTRQATIPNDAAPLNEDTVVPASGKYVVQVRRSSDDAIKSFTATEVTDGTLLSFVGTGGSDNGFVRTWYDQSVTTQAGDTATGNHAVQAIAANQPKIVDAGALLTDGVTFDGGDSLSVSGDPVITASSSGTYSAFSVQTVDVSEDGYLYGNASASNGTSLYANGDSNRAFMLSNANTVALDNIARSAGKNLLSAVYNNGDAGLLVNGAGTMTDSGTYNFSAGTSDFVIGNRNGGSADATFLTGSIREIIVYNSNQTDNRTAIEANMGEVYSIDLPSGVDPGFDQVDGFVETWYDQFGSNNATQPTADNQPKIVNAGTMLNELEFDGSNHQLDFTALNESDVSIFSVPNFDDASGQDRILSTTGGADSSGFGKGSATAGFFRASSGSANQPSLNATISADQDIVYSFIRASNTGTFFTNGTASNTFSNSTAFKASAIGGHGSKIDGSIKELIIYDSNQTAKRTALETNIAAEYGITLS